MRRIPVLAPALLVIGAATLLVTGAETPAERRWLALAASAGSARDAGRELGFPLLLTPVVGAGGAAAATGLVLVAWVAGWLAARALARLVVPEPWATRATVLCALSPASLAAAARIAPDALVGALLAGAALLAVRTRDRPWAPTAAAAATLAALVPWLAIRAAGAVLVLGAAAVRWPRRARRGLAALLAAEALLLSAVVLITVHDALFGRPLAPVVALEPAAPGTLALALAAALPAVGLALAGVAELARRRREHLPAALPALRDAEVAALLGLAGAAALVLGVALVTPGITTFAAALPLLAGPAALGLRRLIPR